MHGMNNIKFTFNINLACWCHFQYFKLEIRVKVVLRYNFLPLVLSFRRMFRMLDTGIIWLSYLSVLTW
jgi:hypothetical protein